MNIPDEIAASKMLLCEAVSKITFSLKVYSEFFRVFPSNRLLRNVEVAAEPEKT